MIAALYVLKNGPYYGLPDVDPWDKERDARRYDGPWPVVAHPPCARWGRYWSGGPSNHGKFKLGDDEGCFAAALASVRKWGGVLEHPADSHAWSAFSLNKPPRSGGWVVADAQGGWTCCVEQGHYGNPSRKRTWLYVVGLLPKELVWESSGQRLIERGLSYEATRRKGVIHYMSKRQRTETPIEFRDLLLAMARTYNGADR